MLLRLSHSDYGAMTNSSLHLRLRQLVCLIYFAGGFIGLYYLLPQLGLFTTSWLALTLFGLLVFQNLVAIGGSALFWQNKAKGAEWLYWLSWTSVPVFSSPLISYHSIIGLGIVPLMRLEPGDYGTDLLFRFGYAGAFKWFPTLDLYQLGFNLIPLVFIAILRQYIPPHTN